MELQNSGFIAKVQCAEVYTLVEGLVEFIFNPSCVHRKLLQCTFVWSGLLYTALNIRESVDSLCRDDADMPMPPYIRKACNHPNAAFVSLF